MALLTEEGRDGPQQAGEQGGACQPCLSRCIQPIALMSASTCRPGTQLGTHRTPTGTCCLYGQPAPCGFPSEHVCPPHAVQGVVVSTRVPMHGVVRDTCLPLSTTARDMSSAPVQRAGPLAGHTASVRTALGGRHLPSHRTSPSPSAERPGPVVWCCVLFCFGDAGVKPEPVHVGCTPSPLQVLKWPSLHPH